MTSVKEAKGTLFRPE